MNLRDLMNPLDIGNYVQQQGEIGRQRGERSYLGRLVSQGLSEPGGLAKYAPQIAAVNPDYGLKVQGLADDQQRRRGELLAERAKRLAPLTPEQRAQVWPSYKAEISAVDPELGNALSDVYDHATTDPLIQQFAGMGGAQPAQIQVFEAQARAAGLLPGSPEYQKAAQIALGLEGRASSAGMGLEWKEDANGVPRPHRNNPRDGTLEMYVAEQNAWIPLGGGQMLQTQPRPQGQRYPTAMVLENERGEPDPFNDLPPTLRAEADRLAAAGLPFHIADGKLVRGLSPGVMSQPTQQPASNRLPSIMDIGGGDPAFNASPFGRGRTKEEEAAAVEAAKLRTQAGMSGDVKANEAEGEGLAKQGLERIDAIRQKAVLASTQSASLDELERQLTKAYTGPGAGAMLSLGKLGTLIGIGDTEQVSAAEAAQAISNRLALSLRNPAGGEGMPGAMSDADRAFLQSSIPSLQNTPDGWKQMIAFQRKLNEAAIDQAREVERFLAAGGKPRDVYSHMQRYAEANPIFAGGGRQGQGPQPGQVEDGYRFKGGDPADQNNWERV